MPWQKGQSGNPAGRPKADETVLRIRKLAKGHAEEAFAALVAALADKDKAVSAAKEILRLAGCEPKLAIEVEHMDLHQFKIDGNQAAKLLEEEVGH